MGSFEKLGILVIVVIIVMILAVAIYQWGAGSEEIVPEFLTDAAEEEAPAPLIVDFVDAPAPEEEPPPVVERPESGTWAGGIPKRHTIRARDTVWDLVVGEWRLKESFIPVIRDANPELDFDRLRPGKVLVVPDPAAYVRGGNAGARASASARTRRYEIQIGDSLDSIARNHLGRSTRWRDIKALNPGLDEKRLRPGQSILIPVK